jgi:hypothetical protein
MPSTKRERAAHALAAGYATWRQAARRRLTNPPADTPVIGSDAVCWCNQPLGHDWPGKTNGAPHPTATQATERMTA